MSNQQSHALVPRVPTKEMLAAGYDAYAAHEWDAGRAKRGPERDSLPIAWRAMIDAAGPCEDLNPSGPLEYAEQRKQHWLNEAQRLALLVRSLGGDPEPGSPAVLDMSQRPGPADAIANIEAYLRDMADQPQPWDDDQLVASAPMDPPDGGSRQQGMFTIGDLKAVVCAFRLHPAELIEMTRKRLSGVEERWNSMEQECPDKGEVSFLIRLAKAYLDSPTNADPAPALRERAEICKVLGCVDKPGVPLRFVQDLIKRNSDQWARINELLRSWDKANPTERQELDRMRRGWGPSSPTERMYRRENVASCLRAIEAAMGELTVSEEESESVPSEAQIYLDAAHAGLARHQETIIGLLQGIATDPAEWPDIKAAEERGAMQAQIAPNEMLMADNRRMRAAGLKLAEAAMHVVREFDGTHRLSLAAAEWAKAIADEGGRGERYAGPAAFEPGRVAYEVRWPAPREIEWDDLTDEQRTVWARVEAASRAIGGSEVANG